MTQTQFAQELGVSRGVVASMERGGTPLTEDIANWLHVTYGYAPAFFAATPTVTAEGQTTFSDVMKPKKHIPRIAALFDEAARISHTLAESTGLPPIHFDGLASLDPEDAATELRTRLGILPDNAVPHVTRAVERLGVSVVVNLDPTADVQFPHLTMSRPCTENTRPLIAALVPPADPARLRFRLLHELGHLIYHADGNPIDTEQYSETERRAHHLAMAMLLPKHVMENQVTEHLLLQGYAYLMRKFGVSIFVVLDRAWHLGLIDDAQRRRLGTEACINRWHKNSPLRVKLEKPRLISDCLDRAYRNDLRAASLDLGTPEHLLAQWAGIESDDSPVPDNVVPLARA